MSKFLYLRLSVSNLRKNKQSYFPFLLACILLTFTTYSFIDLVFNPGIRKLPGAVPFAMILLLGIVIIGLFAAIFLFYANGFLIKRRKKELGLYGILGMEKRHISRVMRYELCLCYIISMILGLLMGILLSRLLFLLVIAIMKTEVPIVNQISSIALALTGAIFAVIFFLLILHNARQVRSVNPIQLLQGGQVGEKEPSSRWFIAILGLIALLGGYFISQRVKDPVEAILLFFAAVLLVILGTYCLFFAGSLSILKMMKRNQNLYYQPRHFVTISGMLYRMKQNAAGLASIAILCTMAMVTIGTTAALYTGAEKTLDILCPSQIKINASSSGELAQIRAATEAYAASQRADIIQLRTFESRETTVMLENDVLLLGQNHPGATLIGASNAVNAAVFDEETFASLQGNDFVLAAGEIAWHNDTGDIAIPSAVIFGGASYTVRPVNSLDFHPAISHSASLFTAIVVVPTQAHVQQFIAEFGESPAHGDRAIYTLQLELDADEAAQQEFANGLLLQLEDIPYSRVLIKAEYAGSLYGLYGGFLFVGVFLGTLFMMATALIIYFKQLSEGYQDHDRFIILQKVGMSQQEVRRTVQTQILIVFFLPLLVAVCHVAGSLRMIELMLRAMSIMDAQYIIISTFAAASCIALLYSLFYLKTAKTYYRLVRM